MTTSPFGSLLQLLQARLKAQVPELRYIDQDLGQLEVERPPVSYHCALIDFVDWSFEDVGDNIQFASGAVIIRLGMQAWSSSSNLTPVLHQDKALSFYDVEWKTYKALHGWKPANYGYLMRTNVNTEEREDNLRVRAIRFSCSFEDSNAQPTHTLAKVTDPEIIAEFLH
jgi:hypothetical protein